MTVFEMLSKEFNIPLERVEKTVELIDEGNTIPFIARYRKEVTGSLDDTVLRDLDDRLTYLRNIRYENAHSLPKYLNGKYLEEKEEFAIRF